MNILITESNVAPKKLIESVEEKGLDPDLYLAVIESELGKAGVVNMNGRIYDVQEFVEENNLLAQRVASGFVEGELGHPMGGPTFDVPVQLKSVDVDVDEEMNTAVASGSFAILNTQSGRDVLTLYKAGMDVGTSSRGSGVVEKHVIDEKSKYYKANPEHEGKEVSEVKEFSLITYDLVRVPSAGTHFQAATTECKEAWDRLNESGLLGASSNPMEEDMVEENKVAVDIEDAPVAPEETVEAVEAVEPEAVEAVESVEEVSVESDSNVKPEEVVEQTEAVDEDNGPVAALGLSENQQKVLLKLASVIESAGADSETELAEQVRRVADQAEVDRVRLAEAEAANQELESRLSALTEEIESRKRAEEIRKSLDESVDGMNHGDEIRTEVEALINEGRIETADEIKVWSNRLSALVENAVAKSVEAAGAAKVIAVDESDDLVESDGVEPVKASAPGIIEESFISKIEKILANNIDR
tara:strand:- start:926 stop:2344 length:1419 start_codon:yes stop_codon:yes gene_type:complete